MTETTPTTLAGTLPKLRRRIQRFRDRKESIGEQNTKAALIDPLLSALGWDLEELDEVCREYKRKPRDKPVDYALFILRSPRLFIEAKDLDKDLSDRKWISQILGYATVVGVEWCVLTNGDEYRLYNAHAPVDVEQKLFRVVRISDPTKEEYTLSTLDLLSKDKLGEDFLNDLWKTQFIDHQVKIAIDDLFQNKDKGLIRLIRKKTPALKPAEVRKSMTRADVQINFPASSVPRQVETTPAAGKYGTHPTSGRKPRHHRMHRVLGVKVVDLIQAGIVNPPLELETTYKRAYLKATIQQDGRITFDGLSYNSLSTAAGMARLSVIGASPGRRYPQTNGWTFWKYRDPDTGKLKQIGDLRRRYIERQS